LILKGKYIKQIKSTIIELHARLRTTFFQEGEPDGGPHISHSQGSW